MTLLLTCLLVGDPAPDAARGAEGAEPVYFETGILPILTKAGCNAGACHGAAIGRGGFRLSLYAGNPDADYASIVHELEGRRVNPAHPQESLLFLKPTESISHGGGFVFDSDEDAGQRLLHWLSSGMPRTPTRLVRFEVVPGAKVMQQPGESVELRAVATWDNGRTEDVTDWTRFEPEDEYGLEVEGSTVASRRRGRHLVTARYRDRVVPVEIVVPFSKTVAGQDDDTSAIDRLLTKRLQVLGLPVSPPTDDEMFLRRATLTLTGRLPDIEDVRRFTDDTAVDKRIALIDRLLASDEFVEFLTWRFSGLLRVRPVGNERVTAEVYQAWLREQIRRNRPWDKLARELVTANGDSHEQGPPNFQRTTGSARDQAEFVSELFMGVRMRCANCHDHPLDRWKQDDYHGLAAIFVRVKRDRVVSLGTRGDVTHPRTGEAAVARLPGTRFLEPGGDPRRALADWMTEPENPWFARAMVNRLWKWTMGRGLIEPADDIRATNPPTHPELLDSLAEDFVNHGYDIQRTVRQICISQAFARSTRAVAGNEADQEYFSRGITRDLEPEVLVDAISDVTGIRSEFPGEQPGTRAVALVDASRPVEALDVLGRCSREESCEAGTTPGGGVAVQLHLVNGALVNERITSGQGRVHALLAADVGDREIVEELYLRSLSRPPTADELKHWLTQVSGAETPAARQQVFEDFAWSLLTCREFVTNH